MIGFAGDLWEVCRLITNLELFDHGISRISDWHYFIKKIDGSVKTSLWLVCFGNGIYIITKELSNRENQT
jgi:hypothetical protein